MILYGSGRRSVTPYVHGLSCIAMCVIQDSVELAWKDFEGVCSKSVAACPFIAHG
jgi:hypothetical protein